jgi:hypothetical protein
MTRVQTQTETIAWLCENNVALNIPSYLGQRKAATEKRWRLLVQVLNASLLKIRTKWLLAQ